MQINLRDDKNEDQEYLFTKKNVGSHTISPFPGLEADFAADGKEELLKGEQSVSTSLIIDAKVHFMCLGPKVFGLR